VLHTAPLVDGILTGSKARPPRVIAAMVDRSIQVYGLDLKLAVIFILAESCTCNLVLIYHPASRLYVLGRHI
jgi:hypothetical protein